jgi:hypothetical protein
MVWVERLAGWTDPVGVTSLLDLLRVSVVALLAQAVQRRHPKFGDIAFMTLDVMHHARRRQHVARQAPLTKRMHRELQARSSSP